jgi:hypothetical protein
MRAISRNLDLTWRNEVPSGAVNGVNTTFTLAFTPAFPNEVEFYVDGLGWLNGVNFTVSGTTITATDAPATAQSVIARYLRRL